ncbi:Transcriptional regulator, LysR family [plant metagenome]|uniref:Transcriptional regulator, LysR family n=2 Tax=root TaxID=1 RepID=A0A1C3K2S3_9BURK|nr:LysR substrate-binding domain-containing protein [Orrella dioscoreae]SBT25803.1 Transcriptional regulator, LysR family [Orrella dioscoreae]SOE51981.1 Transcriptional regulator, LysR family [Orrella dioscoreae]
MPMTTLPSTTALRCLDASARLLSFTRAARELHLTQSAVSHHILQLEQLLGVPLFVRRHGGLDLTAAGQSYWKDIAQVLRHLERATESISATGGRGGMLNLSVSSTLANHWLMPRLHEFVTAHPDITLNLSTRVGPIDFTTSNEDASIEFSPGPQPGLEARLVMPLVLRPYLSQHALRDFDPALARRRKPALSKAQLAALFTTHRLISRTTVPEAWESWLAAAGLAGAVPEEHFHKGPRYALMSMAYNGVIGSLGIALLPRYITHGAVATGQLVCLSDTGWTAPRAYYLRWPSNRAEPQVLRTFSEWVTGLRQDSDT